MRILVVTNLYPPFHKSGYELGCEDIAHSLKSRGHHIQVLTSTYGIQEPQTFDDMHRVLTVNSEDYPNWKDVFLKEFANQSTFKKICAEFEPEISFFFSTFPMSPFHS